MRKLIGIIVAVMMTVSFIIPAYAAAVTITWIEASINNSTKSVSVIGGISSGSGKQVTVRIFDPNSNLEYVDQKVSDSEGRFSFSYTMTNSAKGIYNVVVGGEGVAEPATDTFNYTGTTTDSTSGSGTTSSPGTSTTKTPATNTSTSTPTPSAVTPKPSTEVKVVPQVPKVDTVTGIASTAITKDELTKAITSTTADANGIKTVQLQVPAVEGAKEYRQAIPAAVLTVTDVTAKIQISTEIAKLEVPSNMFANAGIKAENVSLAIKKADTSSINTEVAKKIGNRPVIELDAFAGDTKISWNNNSAPVTVSFKYTPPAEELSKSECITVWYINDQGKASPVPSARYNTATGEITFRTTHFSKYAVTFVTRSFEDLEAYSWAKHDIEVMASKGIIDGTSQATFNPSANITRADFLKLLVNALDLNADFTENFTDVSKDAYYYNYVGVARKLGIVNGDNQGRFNPGARITRQDIMVITARTLKLSKAINEAKAEDIASYKDAGSVAEYAKTSVASLIKSGVINGANGQIRPLSNASRAETAAIIYRLYNK